ncbi:hypothetical protein CGRA01v4_02678 [Colletotrichum graminicola]|uniref:Uncharacterized protein n=1 Tax=Colletotrichum graminicola (strain M1.001 / M2 / FGSC 10212) TaxID=645133 RepID=E3Q452_COLGM|nr:uncharacterized protein GLRG_00508 [Colletotrichum graminicola M1.001]EFQ25364.1 hypothetical protein GLRG_00508 [Colletotrichum graminicola M1.001]WDK11399.1 hypothetical protein CGRA01v4_02678 [Colletotrichum graminicola]
MGLITGLVSTVVHVAAGRNPYGHNQNHDQAAASAHREGHAGCSAVPGGQPCGICAVALPFGKGRQAKFERRAMKHERKAVRHATKAQRPYGAHGRSFGTVDHAAAGPYYQPQQQQQYQQQYQYQRGMAYSGRQEEGVEEWHERRRASTGADVPPPAYEEGEGSAAGARRRSVEVAGQSEKL